MRRMLVCIERRVLVRTIVTDSSDFTKSPTSGRATVGEPGTCHKWGECAASCARRSVCFCKRSVGGVGDTACRFVLECHTNSEEMIRIPPDLSRIYKETLSRGK
jgi:hypothetical protein